MTQPRKIRAIIPAAGRGTRLGASERALPKALHEVLGTPMIDIVLENMNFIAKEDTVIVVGYEGDKLREHLGPEYRYVEQREQLGTGHAVKICAREFSGFDGAVLVAFGDMPLYPRELLRKTVAALDENGASAVILTALDPTIETWARVVRDADGEFSRIVEGRDQTPEERLFPELVAGVFVFDAKDLFRIIPEMGNDNVQHEYYLTEIPALMRAHGLRVVTVDAGDPDVLRGVNTPEELRACEAVLRKRAALATGV